MTYPPQQPPSGQDPYGQDPYQQGSFGQDPYGQQWGGTQPGGFPVGPPPKKPKTGLAITLIIVAILVVGGGGVGAYLLLSKEDKSGDDTGGKHTPANANNARSVADKFVGEWETVLNTELADIDLKPLKPLVCSSDFKDLEDELDEVQDDAESVTNGPGEGDEVKLSIEDFEAGKTEGSFTMVREGEDEGKDELQLEKSNEGWQVCGLYEKDGDDGGGGGDGTSSRNTELPPNPVPTT